MQNKFWRYVLPSMASQMLTGFFIIVDGFFIGQRMGDVGLAAVNILWPIAAIIQATGLGLGSGGSVLLASALGAKNEEKAMRARGNALLFLGAASIFLTVVLWFTYPWILQWLGAQGELYAPAEEYVQVIILCCAAQVLNSGVNPLLRGAGRTFLAMSGMVMGLLCNIFLDWLFIMPLNWGMRGAALATVLAQLLSALFQLVCLVSQKEHPMRAAQFIPSFSLMRRLVITGLSPFGLSLSASILILFNNWQCLRWGGQSAVAIYAILSYLLGSLQPLLTGIGEGMQPLCSYCRGAGDEAGLRRLLLRGLRLVILFSTVLCAASILLRQWIPPLFGASETTAAGADFAIICAALSLPLWGVVRLFSSYFYATHQTKRSLLFIFGDPLVISPLCLYLLPLFAKLDGVWLAAPVAQVILVVLLGTMLWRNKVAH
ncbi:MATE family efflux transporter [uncultured Ruthenibacterium sp.]|uniref:MATE family efflux transporter n=1 Tax=uncultured Ruthenibacterium sp. TaxID=1905347 RepID=UPI00349EF6A2